MKNLSRPSSKRARVAISATEVPVKLNSAACRVTKKERMMVPAKGMKTSSRKAKCEVGAETLTLNASKYNYEP